MWARCCSIRECASGAEAAIPADALWRLAPRWSRGGPAALAGDALRDPTCGEDREGPAQPRDGAT